MPAYAVMHTSTGAAGIQLWIFVFFISSPEDEFGLFITGQGSPPGPFFIFINTECRYFPTGLP